MNAIEKVACQSNFLLVIVVVATAAVAVVVAVVCCCCCWFLQFSELFYIPWLFSHTLQHNLLSSFFWTFPTLYYIPCPFNGSCY